MSPSLLPELVTFREGANQAAIILIHGFGGTPGGGADGAPGGRPALAPDDKARGTFGRLPDYLLDLPDIAGWDLFSLGYPTHLSLDVRGIWSGDPDLGQLATYLSSRVNLEPLSRYRAIALIAHSMGGLIVQHALLDDPDLVGRTQNVVLFGTPSRGLRKASPFAWLKPQMRDMARRGRFIGDLRSRWDNTGWNSTAGTGDPFSLWIVPGLQDQFVPWASSSACFPKGLRHPILGNHLQIVKPSGPRSEPVLTVVAALRGGSVGGGFLNSARVAVEAGAFKEVIRRWLPHADELSQHDQVDLALALDALNRRREAIQLLEGKSLGSDARGVLAGRYKRDWWVDRRRGSGERAWELYAAAYEEAILNGDHDQAYYHGINLAFLSLTFRRDPGQARTFAAGVLTQCEQAAPGFWCSATIGEANLYLGRQDEAIRSYQQALRKNPRSREATSMFQQACWIADRQRDEPLLQRLTGVFGAKVPGLGP